MRDVLRRGEFGGARRGSPFEQTPDVKGVVNLLNGHARDEVAVSDDAIEVAFLPEPRQPLTNGGAAHAVLVGQADLGQGRAGTVTALDDRRFQVAIRTFDVRRILRATPGGAGSHGGSRAVYPWIRPGQGVLCYPDPAFSQQAPQRLFNNIPGRERFDAHACPDLLSARRQPSPSPRQRRPSTAPAEPLPIAPPARPTTSKPRVRSGTPHPTIAIESESLGIIGTSVDFVNTLGIQKSAFKQIKLVLRPAKKHKFRFEYTPISYQAQQVVPLAFVFNGQL